MESFHHDISARRAARFARAVMKALQDAGDATKYEYDPKRLALIGQNGDILLRNMCVAFYATSPHRRPDVIRQLVRAKTKSSFAVEATMREYKDVRPDLFPRLSDLASLEIQRLEGTVLNRPGREDAFVPLAEHLGIGLAFDMPESLIFIPKHALTEWGKTFDEAFADARRNLVEITTAPLEKVDSGLWIASQSDSHDSARLILTDFIRAHRVKGEHVAMVPNRDTLLVTGTEDVLGLTRMASMAVDRREPWGVSGIAVRLQEDTWAPFMPDSDHPAYERFRRLACDTFGRDYTRQKSVLDQKFNQEDAVFVATYVMITLQDSGARSCCTWTEGIKSALPRTDYVAFMTLQGCPTLSSGIGVVNPADLMKPWKRVQEVVGHLMTPMGLYPERYRVETFPSAEHLAAIGSEPLS